MRRVAVAALVAMVVVLVASPAGAQSAGAGTAPAEESARAASNWGWGIELRQSGIGPCRDSTPAPCVGVVYNRACPPSAPGQVRVTRVRTYFGAVGTNFVGFQLRAKLIEHGMPASTAASSTPDVEHFPARQGLTELLMDTKNISGLVDATARWDLQTEFRFDRRGGLSDIVRVRRAEVDVTC